MRRGRFQSGERWMHLPRRTQGRRSLFLGVTAFVGRRPSCSSEAWASMCVRRLSQVRSSRPSPMRRSVSLRVRKDLKSTRLWSTTRRTLVLFCDASDSVGLFARREPLVRRHGAVAHLVTSADRAVIGAGSCSRSGEGASPGLFVDRHPRRRPRLFERTEPDARLVFWSGGMVDAHGQGSSGSRCGPAFYAVRLLGLRARGSWGARPAAEYEETGSKVPTPLRAPRLSRSDERCV